jgi:hypothetical protein
MIAPRSATEVGLLFDELRVFHGCEHLMQCEPCGSIDALCGAYRREGNTLPCMRNNLERLMRCEEYNGPLMPAIRQYEELHSQHQQLLRLAELCKLCRY